MRFGSQSRLWTEAHQILVACGKITATIFPLSASLLYASYALLEPSAPSNLAAALFMYLPLTPAARMSSSTERASLELFAKQRTAAHDSEEELYAGRGELLNPGLVLPSQRREELDQAVGAAIAREFVRVGKPTKRRRVSGEHAVLRPCRPTRVSPLIQMSVGRRICSLWSQAWRHHLAAGRVLFHPRPSAHQRERPSGQNRGVKKSTSSGADY
jgi:hypothetical protein